MYRSISRISPMALIVLSAPFVLIVSISHSGEAIASPECAAAAVRWEEMMPQGAQQTLGGKSMQEILQDTDKRYWIVVVDWIAATMVLEARHQHGDAGDKHNANAVITGNTLRKCWRSDAANWTAGDQALLRKLDELYTAERLAVVLGLAEEIVNDGN